MSVSRSRESVSTVAGQLHDAAVVLDDRLGPRADDGDARGSGPATWRWVRRFDRDWHSPSQRRIEDQRHAEGPQRPHRPAAVGRSAACGRTSAAALLVHQIEISEDAVEHKRNGQAQPGRAQPLGRLGARRIDAIGHQRGGGDDGNHLVEKIRAVFLEDRPVVGRAVGEQRQLVPALAQDQEQGEQRRADEQPVADRHRHGDGAGAARSTNPPAIVRASMMTRCFSTTSTEPATPRRRLRQRRTSATAGRAPSERRRARRRPSQRVAGDNRPDAIGRALERMPLVRVAVGQVVEDVDDAGERAEDRERGDRPAIAWPSSRPAEQHAGEDEQVLRPLLRPKRHQQEPERGCAPSVDFERGIHRVGW